MQYQMEMMPDKSDILFEIIQGRRTVYPYAYTSREITSPIVERIIEAATWAPNHGNTEPWRFKLFKNGAKEELSTFLVSTYKTLFNASDYNEKKVTKLKTWPQKAAIVIAVAMKKGSHPKIPLIEEERAVAAGIQNMLLMAYSYGIASYWSTGKVVYSNEMKSFLGINKEDQVIGLIYFGYPVEENMTKKRRPINEQML